MKKIYSIISIFALLLVISCTNEDLTINTDMGYLRLNVNTVTNAITKGSVPENYNPKQLYVAIVDAAGKTVVSTENFAIEWGNGKEFALKAGVYTIKAHSNGFDGLASRYGDKPYYAGETTITVTVDNSVTADLLCTLADVKVTVRFDSSFLQAFKDAETTISTAVNNINPLVFTMQSNECTGYLPVGELSSSISVRNKQDVYHTQKNQVITNVQPRDHYIFIYKVDLKGDGQITVDADDSERTYTYTFPVTTTPSTTVKVEAANAWSTFAYLSGSVAPKDPTTVIPANEVKFEYQLLSADEESDSWTSISVESNGTNAYKATLRGLTPAIGYRYRLVYTSGKDEYISANKTFTTDITKVLPNGDMENWTKDNKTIDLGGGSFWDTSNPGTTTGAGALVDKNPTQGVTSPVHGGSKAAELRSQYASAFGIGKFAAASLYAGEFGELVGTNGAWLKWGRPFTARPSQLKGWYQYTTGKVDYDGDGPLSGKDNDLWSAQVVLLDLGTADYVRVDNTDMSTFPDWSKDSRVVAYGKLSDDICKQQKTNWTQFVIDLEYKNLTKKPTHIIIVFSSSKYGDYFEGSTSSLLYLDDLELVYGEPTLN
ncbi:MAG: PCMD domain-containing protein [Parabacteroides sp.]|nr:PCMD domain-containing protein [Parabacteroides sp.]